MYGKIYSIPWITPLYPWSLPYVKKGGLKYHFLSLWYDSTWDWTPFSGTIGKHSTHEANGLVNVQRFRLKTINFNIIEIHEHIEGTPLWKSVSQWSITVIYLTNKVERKKASKPLTNFICKIFYSNKILLIEWRAQSLWRPKTKYWVTPTPTLVESIDSKVFLKGESLQA